MRTFQLSIAGNDFTSVFFSGVLYVLIKHSPHTVIKRDKKEKFPMKILHQSLSQNAEAMCGEPQVVFLLDHL